MSSELPKIVNYPETIDPATGEVVELGRGLVAKMGETGVTRVVQLPIDCDMIDILVSRGELTYSA